jgi:hypothetical protein
MCKEMRGAGASYLAVPGLSLEECTVEAFARYAQVKAGLRKAADFKTPLYTQFERELMLRALEDFDPRKQTFLGFAAVEVRSYFGPLL